MNKIAFIGAGNMSRAIIIGLIKQGVPANTIIVSNPSPEKRIALAEEFNILQTSDNIEAANFADTIVLSVKPHLIADVCKQISAEIDVANKGFISVAAGCTVNTIQQALGGKYSIVRCMPNTPAQLGLGMSGLFASNEVSDHNRDIADTLLSAVGKVMWVDTEAKIDDIICVSGSGPAYFFLFMEAMEKQAQAQGFTAAESRLLVQQTALGAAQMVEQNNIAISQLRENVTSKGGTTQAALKTFTDGGLEQLVTKSMTAALHRAQEMAQNNS